jgi:hypothetical protein
MNHLRFGNKTYCEECKRSIIFIFNIGSPYLTKIEIPIPKDKEWGLPYIFFFEELAR